MIATVTLARSDDEETTLRLALERLSREGLPVAVSDGGSRSEFVEFLRGLAGFTVVAPLAPGLVGQVKAALRVAGNRPSPFVLYTEPDKHFFFDRRLTQFLANAPLTPDIGVVLAARDEQSFETFPRFQRLTEGAFNAICAAIFGQHGDYNYGPFIVNRKLLAHLDRVNQDLGWGWRPFVFSAAHRLGYRIVHMIDDLPCPPDQRVDDERERVHRLRQLRQNVEGLLLSADSKLT
jgi:hypothetical protein